MQAINAGAAAYINNIISPQVSVIGYEVRNRWLIATLDSGVHMWVRNDKNYGAA